MIKDTGVLSNIDIGWLKAEQRWTVSNFHEAKVILNQGIGFCWIPSFLIQEELAAGKLVRLHLQGSQKRRIMLSLVIPNRDHQGPASKLLASYILKHHGVSTTD